MRVAQLNTPWSQAARSSYDIRYVAAINILQRQTPTPGQHTNHNTTTLNPTSSELLKCMETPRSKHQHNVNPPHPIPAKPPSIVGGDRVAGGPVVAPLACPCHRCCRPSSAHSHTHSHVERHLPGRSLHFACRVGWLRRQRPCDITDPPPPPAPTSLPPNQLAQAARAWRHPAPPSRVERAQYGHHGACVACHAHTEEASQSRASQGS